MYHKTTTFSIHQTSRSNCSVGMGVASSKVFVNRMLRNGLDETNDPVCAGSHYNGTRLDTVNWVEESFHHQQVDDDEDDTTTNLLLSLLAHHSNLRKKKQLIQRKVAALRRRRARVTLPEKKRRIARRRFFVDPISGVRRPMTPTLSNWWVVYIQDPNPECRHWSKLFRQRFRLPYDEFLKLLSMMQDDSSNDIYFRRWKTAVSSLQLGEDQESNPCPSVAPPRKVSPMELLLLGSLRYLGRGWTFDDLEESTYITRDVHRCFFHQFCAWGAKVLYPMYVQLPKTLQDLRACEKEYSDAGFPGCVGSTDATHIPLEKVSFGLRQAHLGYKMSSTSRTYNLTVNHRRQILHSTTGHPGRWNDKTLVRFDSFMAELRNGALNETMSFELRNNPIQSGAQEQEEPVAAATETTRTIKGAYVIVDNGYLNWSSTVPPIKHSCNRSEIRFSQWLESLRKDVECTFGILKGRWRVLKSGIRVHNTVAADNIWLTCCALHNLLLDVDGLSVGWENGVPSHWEGERGQFEDDEIPEAIRRLISPDAVRTYDQSSCGYNPAARTAPAAVSDDKNDDGQ